MHGDERPDLYGQQVFEVAPCSIADKPPFAKFIRYCITIIRNRLYIEAVFAISMKEEFCVRMVKMTVPLKTAPKFSLTERDALSEAFEIAENKLDIEYELDDAVRSKLRALIIHVGRGRLRLGIDITDAFAIQSMAADAVELLYVVRRLAV